jgi:hypothetical protein
MSAPTPRTDALVGELYGMASPLAMPKITMIEHARQLESELSTANNAYSGVERVNLELQRELAEANAELERRQAKIMRLSSPPEAVARDEIIEACAKVCEVTALQIGDRIYPTCNVACAAALRALKGNGMNPSPKEPT